MAIYQIISAAMLTVAPTSFVWFVFVKLRKRVLKQTRDNKVKHGEKRFDQVKVSWQELVVCLVKGLSD